jgi:MFS family permease
MIPAPRPPTADQAMRWRQVVAVAVCIALNGLDGFDVLAISFASPGIATEWGIGRATLGVVLSVELFGMAAGSVLMGNVADRFGRKPTVIGCLVMMAAGMFGAAHANSIPMLAAVRLLTGLGIGGMLASTSAIVADVSTERRRNLNLSLNIAGYPAGAILGGSVATFLLAHSGNWRAVFQFGALASAIALPLAAVLLPKLEPARVRSPATLPLVELFRSGYAYATVLLTAAYLAQIMVFYYIQKWVPKIIVDMGHTAAEAGAVLVSANVGSLVGACLIGLAAQKYRVIPLIVGAMAAAFLCIVVFGLGDWSLQQLTLICAIAGVFVNAGVVGLYPLMGQVFPAELRATGIGFAIGVGRGGAALGPMAAGALFSSGYNLLEVSTVMGTGALIAAVVLLVLGRLHNGSSSAGTLP